MGSGLTGDFPPSPPPPPSGAPKSNERNTRDGVTGDAGYRNAHVIKYMYKRDQNPDMIPPVRDT